MHHNDAYVHTNVLRYMEKLVYALPNTIQITIQFPTIATISITPNKNAHSAFCSHENSYGRFDDGFMHSAIKSLAAK